MKSGLLTALYIQSNNTPVFSLIIHLCIHVHVMSIISEHLRIYSFNPLTSHMPHLLQESRLPFPFCSAKSLAFGHIVSISQHFVISVLSSLSFSLFLLGVFLYRQISNVSGGNRNKCVCHIFFYSICYREQKSL